MIKGTFRATRDIKLKNIIHQTAVKKEMALQTTFHGMF